MVAETKERFNLGRKVATPGALAEIEEMARNRANQLCIKNEGKIALLKMAITSNLFDKHSNLEQGDLNDSDYQQNLDAVKRDEEGHLQARIFSAYKLDNIKFWVITEWDESATTLLLPSEY